MSWNDYKTGVARFECCYATGLLTDGITPCPNPNHRVTASENAAREHRVGIIAKPIEDALRSEAHPWPEDPDGFYRSSADRLAREILAALEGKPCTPMTDAEALFEHAEACDGTVTLSGTGQYACSCGWKTEPFLGRADAQYFVPPRPPAPIPIPDDAVIPEWRVGSPRRR